MKKIIKKNSNRDKVTWIEQKKKKILLLLANTISMIISNTCVQKLFNVYHENSVETKRVHNMSIKWRRKNKLKIVYIIFFDIIHETYLKLLNFLKFTWLLAIKSYSECLLVPLLCDLYHHFLISTTTKVNHKQLFLNFSHESFFCIKVEINHVIWLYDGLPRIILTSFDCRMFYYFFYTVILFAIRTLWAI